MISVIVPLMPIKPYDTMVDECVELLRKQTAKPEIIVAVQPVERYINKNKLLNDAFAKSNGNFVMHCDVDFRLTDETLLQRMKDRIVKDDLDVLYPKFVSQLTRKNKIADGGPMFTRSGLYKVGKLDESLLGISYTTFPLLAYCLRYLRFDCSDDFMVDVIQNYASVKRKNGQTAKRLKPLFKETVSILKGRGAWPA